MALVRATIAGRTFQASPRTIAHLKRTIWKLRIRFPWARLEIIQTCYNTGVAASAGTHDYDCVFDVRIRGIKWWTAQRFLRYHGWAAWFRHTGQWSAQSAWHIHMVSLPTGLTSRPTTTQIRAAYRRHNQRVGEYVPGQVYDYYRHALGLKGQHASGSDTSRFPEPINKYVFKG